MLRGGAFKPRTSPYSFQGMGEDGLKILKATGERFGMPVVTEVMDPRQLDMVVEYADMIQIGARNMQNFDLLKEVGRTRTPVLLKRGMAATVKDLLMSAEYILSQGNREVVLCERGIRSFEDSTRNMLDLSSVPNIQGLEPLADHRRPEPCHRSSRLDPEHGASEHCRRGRRGSYRSAFVPREGTFRRSAGALAAGNYARLMREIRQLAEVMGKTIDAAEGVSV